MHARLSRFAGLDPERIDETIRQFEEQALEDFKRQPGFKGITAGVNHRTGQAVVMTVWETERHMRDSERLADEARSHAVETARPSREPIVDNYEVVLHA